MIHSGRRVGVLSTGGNVFIFKRNSVKIPTLKQSKLMMSDKISTLGLFKHLAYISNLNVFAVLYKSHRTVIFPVLIHHL